MSKHEARAILAVLLLLLLSVAGSHARSEDVVLVDGALIEGGLGVSVRSWTLKKEGAEDVKVSEIAAPLRLRKPLGARGDLSLEIPGVWASIEGEGSSEYRGPADAKLSASYRPSGRGTRIGLFLEIPTGQSKTHPAERAVAGAAADRLLGLPIKRFGEGFDAGASLVQGFSPARRVSVSAGAGYLLKGEYAFLGAGDAEEKYAPGDEIFLTAGAGGEWGGAVVLLAAADFRYRMFAVDKRNGEDFYEEGDEASLLLDGSVRIGPGRRIDVRAFLVFKGEGSEGGAFGEGSIDSLSVERYLQRSLTGDYREFSASYTHRIAAGVDLSADVRAGDFGEYAFAEGAHLLGSGRVYELGAGVGADLSSHYRLLVHAARLLGEAEEGAIDLTGFDLAASVQWVY
ncbi:MAG: hypothetical protein ABIH26_08710 [Candidatus Eisenbacteria bacterium]